MKDLLAIIACLIVGTLIVNLAWAFLRSDLVALEKVCARRWEHSNLETLYDPETGCHVRTKDGFILEEYYRP